MVRAPKISPESQHIPAAPVQPGYRVIAGPALSPLTYLEFGLLSLAQGQPSLTWQTREREVAFYLLGGTCEVTVSGGAGALAGTMGPRSTGVDGSPAGLSQHTESRVE